MYQPPGTTSRQLPSCTAGLGLQLLHTRQSPILTAACAPAMPASGTRASRTMPARSCEPRRRGAGRRAALVADKHCRAGRAAAGRRSANAGQRLTQVAGSGSCPLLGQQQPDASGARHSSCRLPCTHPPHFFSPSSLPQWPHAAAAFLTRLSSGGAAAAAASSWRSQSAKLHPDRGVMPVFQSRPCSKGVRPSWFSCTGLAPAEGTLHGSRQLDAWVPWERPRLPQNATGHCTLTTMRPFSKPLTLAEQQLNDAVVRPRRGSVQGRVEAVAGVGGINVCTIIQQGAGGIWGALQGRGVASQDGIRAEAACRLNMRSTEQ